MTCFGTLRETNLKLRSLAADTSEKEPAQIEGGDIRPSEIEEKADGITTEEKGTE